MTIKEQTDYSNYEALDMRVGRILSAERLKAKKPTYRIVADFGPETGEKVTVAAYTHYESDLLVGKLIIGIMNLGTLKMGREPSEFFCIGAPNKNNKALPLTVIDDVPLGSPVY